MDRTPITLDEPDFGYPSQEEFELVSQYFRDLEAYYRDRSLPEPIAGPEIDDIMRRNFAGHDARDKYWRKSTKEIPEYR